MQFFKLAALLAFPILAAATPGGSPTTKPPVTTTVTVTATPTATTVSQCNTGDIQCCDSTESASSAAGTTLLGLLGIVLSNLNVLLGVDCSPITVIGVGGASCDASPVCCENNNFNGLVSIGCVPITL